MSTTSSSYRAREQCFEQAVALRNQGELKAACEQLARLDRDSRQPGLQPTLPEARLLCGASLLLGKTLLQVGDRISAIHTLEDLAARVTVRWRERPVSREPASRESANRESASREPASRESASRESANRESASREPASREPASREPASRESANRESASRESARSEPPSRDPECLFLAAVAKLTVGQVRLECGDRGGAHAAFVAAEKLASRAGEALKKRKERVWRHLTMLQAEARRLARTPGASATPLRSARPSGKVERSAAGRRRSSGGVLLCGSQRARGREGGERWVEAAE